MRGNAGKKRRTHKILSNSTGVGGGRPQVCLTTQGVACTCTGMYTFFKFLKKARANATTEQSIPSDIDLSWFKEVENLVMSEYMHKSKNTHPMLERAYHILLKEGTSTLDTERGSLTLNLKNAGTFVFAISDVTAGAQLIAAMKLGGWILRLRPTGTGLVDMLIVWEGHAYRLDGVLAEVRQT